MTIKSIREYDRLADRIRLHRQIDKNPVIIVEGPSDVLMLNRAFPHEWTYFPAGTRPVALQAVRELHGWNTQKFIGVVDRDFDDDVQECEKQGLPLLPYENADIEAMLANGKAYLALLNELGSSEKISKGGGTRAILQIAQKTVEPIALLRRANFENQWGLAFDEVDVASKIDPKTLKLKLQPYCAALSATVSNDPSQSILLDYATGKKTPSYIPSCPRGSEPYYRGRDLLAVTGVALRALAGSCARNITDAEHLAKVLRLTATAFIYHSKWGSELVERLGANSPVKQ
ncbi:DUF4435 domain-containing protein [Streptomyces sp. DSM 40750]|uniref:DUF4435 domain-containing protein n=1 Tax=Streptomyces sp. DSM 40750 TaxID=2801030 RepID=UPI00214A9814|nr:DUF4435 domain-containing protein [Streptomyces sp. DSM 40750]UUU23565.1 hypothetical protein JIX55_26725 [Streptomyces sp. DSM 40750]